MYLILPGDKHFVLRALRKWHNYASHFRLHFVNYGERSLCWESLTERAVCTVTNVHKHTVRLSACLCRFACLLTYVLTCLLAYLHAYFLTFLLAYFLAYLLTFLLSYLLTYLFTYLLTFLLAYLLNFLLTYLLTFLLSYLLTFLLT